MFKRSDVRCWPDEGTGTVSMNGILGTFNEVQILGSTFNEVVLLWGVEPLTVTIES